MSGEAVNYTDDGSRRLDGTGAKIINDDAADQCCHPVSKDLIFTMPSWCYRQKNAKFNPNGGSDAWCSDEEYDLFEPDVWVASIPGYNVTTLDVQSATGARGGYVGQQQTITLPGGKQVQIAQFGFHYGYFVATGFGTNLTFTSPSLVHLCPNFHSPFSTYNQTYLNMTRCECYPPTHGAHDLAGNDRSAEYFAPLGVVGTSGYDVMNGVTLNWGLSTISGTLYNVNWSLATFNTKSASEVLQLFYRSSPVPPASISWSLSVPSVSSTTDALHYTYKYVLYQLTPLPNGGTFSQAGGFYWQIPFSYLNGTVTHGPAVCSNNCSGGTRPYDPCWQNSGLFRGDADYRVSTNSAGPTLGIST